MIVSDSKNNYDALIFKLLSPTSNDKISQMSGLDLQLLILLLDEYYIELRDSIGVDQSNTFGFELEVENARIDEIYNKILITDLNYEWTLCDDCTLDRGIELISSILRDNKESWNDLNKVCSVLREFSIIGENSGGHIHIGTQILGNNKDAWLNFIRMWSIYENIIFRFCYGEFLTARLSIIDYASPIANKLWRDYNRFKNSSRDLEFIISEISHRRYLAINFENVDGYIFSKKNTIEFRCPNGSLSPAIWQNNVNFFAKLLTYSSNPLFDDDTLEKRYRINKDKFYGLKWYDEIYLEQALELCDMIFDNNLDKIYFLRQYLKSFEVCKNPSKYPKAKPFVREKVMNIR